MLTTAVRIKARLEADIGAVVPRDDCFGEVAKKLRVAPRLFFLFAGRIDLDYVGIAQIDVKLLEPVRRVPGRASSVDGRRGWGRLLNDRNEFLFGLLLRLRHETSSHEHMALSSVRWIGRSVGRWQEMRLRREIVIERLVRLR